MPNLEREGDVFVVNLGDGENRLNRTFLDELSELVTQVEKTDGPKAMVTSATGKFWSIGLDLDWMKENPAEVGPFISDLQEFLAKFLTLPFPTVAAIQGHAFAGGAILSLTHDYSVMRDDKGFWCLPEVDINIAFTAALTMLIQSRLIPQVAHEAMTTGKRYGGDEAASLGIVGEAASADEVLPRAKEIAAGLAEKASTTLGTIKERMYSRVTESLRSDPGF